MTGKDIRKLCLSLSMNLFSDYHRFTEMAVDELLDVCSDYNELMDERKVTR